MHNLQQLCIRYCMAKRRVSVWDVLSTMDNAVLPCTLVKDWRLYVCLCVQQ